MPEPASHADIERLQSKLIVDGATGCHIWTGCRNTKGYGLTQAGGKLRPVHQVAYEAWVGPIPAGTELDHLCHTRDPDCNDGSSCLHRACANPAHLEPVSHRVNVLRGNSFAAVNARKTHCLRGHEFKPGSYYPMQGRGRQCRECKRIVSRAWKAKQRELKRGRAA